MNLPHLPTGSPCQPTVSRLLLLLAVAVPFTALSAPVKLILDTDIGPDVDDAGAVGMLHALADNGEAEILAMMVSAGGHTGTWGAPCLDAINTYYGRPDIPLGVTSSGPPFNSSFNEEISQQFPQDIGTTGAWDATTLYRKILSEQPDNSVVILTIGFLSNLEDLLNSGPDQFSALNGTDLVSAKVQKWVCEGGIFPNGSNEFNLTNDTTATIIAIDNWPTPILFSGFELGVPILNGGELLATPVSNPVRVAYQYFNEVQDRSSWDQTGVLATVRDPELYWDVVTEGYYQVNPDKTHAWLTSPDKNHSYLVPKVANETIEKIIGELMIQPPALGTPEPDFSISTSGLTATFDASETYGGNQTISSYHWNLGDSNSTTGLLVSHTFPSEDSYTVTLTVHYGNGLSTSTQKQLTVPAPALSDSLVSHLPLDEVTGDVANNSSETNLHGLVSGAEWTAGREGNALKFDGTGAVELPADPATSLETFTLMAWIQIPEGLGSGWKTIMDHNWNGENWYGLWKTESEDTFHFRWSKYNDAQSFNKITPNIWHHVAGTYDAETATATLYLDGKVDRIIRDTSGGTPVLDTVSKGRNGGGQEHFKGLIDDVRIYERALTKAEIQNVFLSYPSLNIPIISFENAEAPNDFRLKWSSHPQDSYCIQFAESLDDDFEDYLPGISSGGSETEHAFPSPSTSKGFFRVIEE